MLDRTVGGLANVGEDLEKSQEQVEGAKARQKDLGRRARNLEATLEEQKEASACSRARLEDRVRAAYKGGDLEGLLLLLEGLFGGGDARGSTAATLQATRLLTESSRSIQGYKANEQNLETTLRQLEQSKAEYREFGEESQALVEELKGRESELRASVEGLGLERDRLEERLAELEAEEEAGLLKRPPATGGGDRVEPQEERDDKPDADEEEAREQARERELEIAREEIQAQPVEPIPYEEYVRLYRESAERYGFGGDWYVLAAVGKIESNHGENMGPSSAGAMGPMQFLPSTWSSYGVDGNGDGETNILDPQDAIPAAAAYLKAGGAPDDWYAALFTYNRAGWYVEEVLAIAESYRRIHGDDSVGPYLEPVTAPAEEAPSRTRPAPEPADRPDVDDVVQEERPPDERTPPPDAEIQPDDEALPTEETTAPVPEDTVSGGGTTMEQYQD
ncbi:lytic transglycosylase domain-containing protein [Rubrobacter marinus]|uniref:lytic transglycosylase domain-containing protein n=1 Tax=Rubrobacter marinus TaxID=2653852 RepID=UPI001A9F20E3|nr:lytic transglycosylase domain-containing protein [Rubrobacter marinus]